MAAGRPSKAHEWLEPENLILIEGWAKDGLTDAQIAHNMGIHRATLHKWRNKYSVLNDTLKKGKEVVDREVENALFKRAVGYEYEEVKKIVIEKADGTKEKRIEKTTKVIVPDVTAQIFWLKNRKPAEWRDKREVEIENDDKLDEYLETVEKYAKD